MSQASDFGRKLKPTLRLTFIEGPRSGSVIDLEAPSPGGPPATLGRNRENTITIDSAHLSRRHAEIFSDPLGRIFIRDAGSINGTIVNGRPVTTTDPALLKPGDRVQVGDTIFVYDGVVMGDSNPEVTALDTRLSLPGTSRTFSNTTPLQSQETNSNPSSVEGAYVYLLLRNGQRYLFEGEEATIGRGQGNDIVIDSNSISRQHARLQRTPAGIFVTDLGSTNKTFVNGVRADGPVLLRHNDVIRFGDIEVDFRIEKERQTGMVNFSDQTMIEILNTDATQREFASNSFDSEDVNPSNWTGPSLEQLETALDLDIRIVGRMQRRASDALPETPPVAGSGTGAPTPVVNTPYSSQIEVARVEGVYYTEGQGRAAQLILQDIRLGLRQGELVAVVGPSGSGKSELVQIMAGFLPADRGRVLILGRDIPTYESAGRRLNLEGDKDFVRWRARNIGYYSSGHQLDPRRPVYEQVMQPMEQAGIGRDTRERQERAFERLALVEISAEVGRLRPTELNRTERQLVMLARTLANDPPLILCDEPLGNLTSKAANFVFTLLQRLAASNKTVLMVTQDQLWARNSSRMIEILDGVIVGSLV